MIEILCACSRPGRRRTAVAARGVALQMIQNTIVCAPDELRELLRKMTRMQLIRTLAAWRPDSSYPFSRIARAGQGTVLLQKRVFIPETLGRDIDNKNLGRATLFGRLEKANDLRIAEVQQTIGAIAAPAAVARWLGIRAGAPMLKTTRIYRLAGGDTVECAVTYYDLTRFQYDMKLLQE